MDPVLVCVSVHESSASVCLLYRCNVGVCPVDLILVYVSDHCPLLWVHYWWGAI